MTSSNIRDHFVKRHFYESLQSTRFCLSRPEAFEGLDAGRSIPKTLAMIKRRCFQSRATCEEAIELRDLVQKVVGDFEETTAHWEEFHDVLDAMNRVGVIGAKLLQSERVVTGLNSRDPFAPQEHAPARRKFYWLHAPSMDKFEGAIGQLLPYGTLEPFSLSETLEAKESIEMNSLQRILFCYGAGMSQAVPYAVFADVPVLWKDFMSECADLEQSSTDVRCERNAYMQHALGAALPSLRKLVAEKANGRGDYVNFQSMLSTDPGIEALRKAFQNESKWN